MLKVNLVQSSDSNHATSYLRTPSVLSLILRLVYVLMNVVVFQAHVAMPIQELVATGFCVLDVHFRLRVHVQFRLLLAM